MKKYNHLYALAFSVDTDRDGDAPVDVNEILAAISKRMNDLSGNREWDEAICPPLETVENHPDTSVSIHTRCAEASQLKALQGIRADIAAFDAECEADAYTDTGAAWDLFASITNICERELKNIIDTENRPAPEVVMRFRNHYRHCGVEWDDEWDSTCNDKCPECNAEIEPYKSEDLDEQSDSTSVGEPASR
jgi:hypothetical protein